MVPAKGWELATETMSMATQHARQTLQPPRGLSAVLDYAGASHRRAAALFWSSFR